MSQLSIHKMQRYILGGVVLMSAVGLSFPIAMARVSATKQFPGQAVKSQDCASQTLKESKVVEWAKDCAPLKVEPKKTNTKPPAAETVTIAPAASSGPSPKRDESNALKLGMSGSAVTTLQKKLQSKGGFSLSIDGVFGEDTEAAVRQLQTQMKLESTGIADVTFQNTIESQPY